MRWNLKIRFDAVAASSLLFTVALLLLAMPMLENALVTHQSRFQDIAIDTDAGIPGDQVVIPNYDAPMGITSLAIIAIGLIVTWAGYIKGVRWTWFVMFVIVWLWAFPVLMLPFLYPWNSTVSIAQTLASAIDESGMARTFVEVVLVFLIMVLALVLPVKTFIRGHGGGPGKSAGADLGTPDRRSTYEI